MELARAWPRPPMTDLPAQPRMATSAESALPPIVHIHSRQPHELCAVFERERDGLFRFLWRLTGNASDADDLLQDTFLTAWRKPELFRDRDGLGAYLRRTAYRLFLNARRKHGRRGELALAPAETSTEAAATSVAEREAREQLRTRVQSAIEALPEGTREVFLMFRFEGMCCAEIARVCEISVDAVEGRIERATRLLAVRLVPHAEDMPEL